MTNEELIPKIKAEIDKLYGEYKDKFHQRGDQYHLGLIDGLDMAERVLDTLESGTTYDTHQYNPRPSVGIDDVARVQFASHAKVFDKKRKAVFDWEQFKEVAGIFYGFGKKDRSDIIESEKPINPEEAMKELDEKIALVKQRGTWDGVDVDKYMDEVRGREPEKPMNQDEELNEEIKKFIAEYDYERSEDILLIAIVARHFAEWQKEQDDKELSDLLTIAHLQGAEQMKEMMMEEAIHYVVQDDLDSHGASYNIPFVRIGTTALKPKGIGVGDKVRIIIVKEDEK